MGAIRLFLALVVAFDHFRVIILKPENQDIWSGYALGMNAGYAVMYFYAISGFLMSMVLDKKYPDTATGMIDFYRNRAVRIFSLYLPIALLILLLIPDIRHMFLATSLADKVTALGLFGMSWRIGFADYPAEHWDAAIFGLRQAWTLDAELTFYLVAPIVLRSRGLTAAIFGASAATRAWFVSRYGFDNLWTYHFLPSTFLFFLLGHIAYRSSLWLSQLRSAAVGVAAIAASFIILNFQTNAYWDSARFWFAFILFVVALPGVFESTKSSRILNFAGNLSFPVYLIHLILIVQGYDVGLLKKSEMPPEITCALFISALLIVSAMVYRFIEQPFASLLQSLLRSVISADHLRASAIIHGTEAVNPVRGDVVVVARTSAHGDGRIAGSQN